MLLILQLQKLSFAKEQSYVYRSKHYTYSWYEQGYAGIILYKYSRGNSEQETCRGMN